MDHENTEPTVREALTDAIADHSDATAPVDTAAPVAAEPAATEKPAALKPDADGRLRAPDGKFATDKPKATQESPTSPAAAHPAVPEAAPAVATQVQPVPRPSSWAKEMWPLWDKLNTGAPLTAAEARQIAEYNAKRETQFATGVSTYKQQADSAKPIMDAIAPFQADLDRHGLPAAQTVYNLLAAHRTMALGSPQQKLQYLGRIAQDYGIPIQALYDQNVQQQYLQSAPAAPAHVQQPAPQQDIAKLVEETIANREVQQTVESMAKDQQKYPFFHYVRPTMARLLEAGEATDLNDAYSKALEAPEHAALAPILQQQQTAAVTAQQTAAAQAAARTARANTVSTKSATPAATNTGDGKKSVREALMGAIEANRTGARV